MKKQDAKDSLKKAASTGKSLQKDKRFIERIPLFSTWAIRTQFWLSILLVNLCCLVVIIVSILGVFIGLGVLVYSLTRQEVQETKLLSFQVWTEEETGAISNKLSYYFTVNDYMGSLILGMNMKDDNLFQNKEYPLNQPTDPSFNDLPTWTSVDSSSSSATLIASLKAKTKALNYFAQSLLTPFEDIPINRMSATFVGWDSKPILTISYPNDTAIMPPYPGSSWYSNALNSPTYSAWALTYDTDGSPLLQLSKRFDQSNGSAFVVTNIELSLNYVQLHAIDQFEHNSGSLTSTIIIDIYGNIISASSALGYDFTSPCPNIIDKKLGKITLTGAQLKLVRSIAELETGDVLTYTDSGSNTYYLTASRLLLPFSNNGTLYAIYIYYNSEILSSLTVFENDIIDKTINNIIITSLAVFGAFLIMTIMSLGRSRRFLEPWKIISDYAFAKNAETINKNDTEKEIKPIKLPDGVDEIGELIGTFKKLVEGLPTPDNEKEADSKKMEKNTEVYPKNYLKGKSMPWREELRALQPRASRKVSKENLPERPEAFMSWLSKASKN